MAGLDPASQTTAPPALRKSASLSTISSSLAALPVGWVAGSGPAITRRGGGQDRAGHCPTRHSRLRGNDDGGQWRRRVPPLPLFRPLFLALVIPGDENRR